ncbi:MAG: stage V sporulation protein D, partial [Clostridia bacterium]|nr:stage V sporulation protein D [Clostridia bacterium]
MKNQEFTIYSLRKRISAFIIAISFLFFALIARLLCIQIFNGENLQLKAYNQWTRDLPIAAERGKIYDTNGATLAVSFTTYDVYVRGREVKDVSKVASLLSKKLNMSYDIIYSKASLKNVSEVLIKLQVDSVTAKEIAKENLSGIFLSESIKRYYPYGDLLTQILGFTTVDNIGQAGLEAYFNDVLAGQNGSFLVQSDLQGKEIENSLRLYIDGVAGDNIYLTIDVNIQTIVENVLQKIMQEQKCVSASCIIMNAKNGEIIASSTKPSFDLNDIPRNDAQALMNMVKNKLVVDVYEPGSTFKILTMSAALESNNASLSDHFYCGGYSIVDGQKIKCWKTIGHGSIDLTEGLVNSCNCVFMALAQKMGTQNFYNYLKSFGIGTKTGVQIASESNGILMDQSIVKNVDLARIGFGQAVAVTPLQLITAVCCAVNGGELNTPSIIKKTTSYDGVLKSVNYNNKKTNVISSKTSNTLNQMLKKVVNKDKEYSFVEGYDVGGKTGTAQKYENGAIARGKYISSFIGTYPASDPEYVMLLLVDEPGAGAYYGSVVAAPYGKEIFSKMFEYMTISPIKEVKTEYFEMPNLVNKSLLEAITILNEIGVD